MTKAKIKMMYVGEEIEFFETESTGLYAFGITNKNIDNNKLNSRKVWKSYKEIRTANGNLIYSNKNVMDKEWELQEVKLIDGIIIIELHRSGEYYKSLKLADGSGQVVDFVMNDIVGYEEIDEIYRYNAEGKFERTNGLLVRAVRILNNLNNAIAKRTKDLYVAHISEGKLEVRHIEKMEMAYGVWSLTESKNKRFAVVEGRNKEDNIIFGYETTEVKGKDKLIVVGSRFSNTEVIPVGDTTDRFNEFKKTMRQFKNSDDMMRIFCVNRDYDNSNYEDVMCISKYNYMTFGGACKLDNIDTKIIDNGQKIEFRVEASNDSFELNVVTDGTETKIEYDNIETIEDDGDETGENTEIGKVVNEFYSETEDYDELMF